MRKQLTISSGAILAMLAMTAPALAQGFCGVPAGCGFGAPFGGFGPGPVGCGFGLPFGIGACGFDPFSSIIGLGLSMINTVIGAAFSCIPLGGPGFGCGIPFAGCGIPFGGFC